MNKKHKPLFPLVFQYIIVSVIAVTIAFLMHYLIYEVATSWYLYDERFTAHWERWGEAYVDNFQEHVTMNGLTCNHALTDIEWGRMHYEVDLFVEPDYSTEPEGLYYPIGKGPADYGLVPLLCSDGVIYTKAYPSEIYYYSRARAIVGLLGAICFLLVTVPFILHAIKRIGRLYQAVGVLSSGQLDQPVSIRGKDEIGELGEGIDQMRCALLSAKDKERAIAASNYQLRKCMGTSSIRRLIRRNSFGP